MAVHAVSEVLEQLGVVVVADDVALLPRELPAPGNGESAALVYLSTATQPPRV